MPGRMGLHHPNDSGLSPKENLCNSSEGRLHADVVRTRCPFLGPSRQALLTHGPYDRARASRCIREVSTARRFDGVTTHDPQFRPMPRILASIALPSLAATRCDQPYAPEIHLAANATKEQIATLRDDVQAFVAHRTCTQACLTESRFLAGSASLPDATRFERRRIERRVSANLFNASDQLPLQASERPGSVSGKVELVSR